MNSSLSIKFAVVFHDFMGDVPLFRAAFQPIARLNPLTDYSSQYVAIFVALIEKVLNNCCEVFVEILAEIAHFNV
ncbi:MAG: hypothetical protein ABL862_08780 [Candidatus Nitrotoga sp.]